MTVELSVIIVNYNGKRFLQDCLDSLYRCLDNINFEIVVIDNNSTDDSCNFLQTDFPEVMLIQSSINLGFGKGNNKAVEHANGKYLLLINNDTVVLDPISPALDFLKSDKSIGVIGINMLNGDAQYLTAAGNFPNFKNMLRMKYLLQLSGDFKTQDFKRDSYDVDWLGGSFLLLKKETYTKIGGFDQDYFMYVEDVDLCRKIANLGLRRVFLPNLSYIHFVGFNKTKNPLLVKGYEIYIRKHFRGLKRKLLSLALFINKTVKRLKDK
jgi:GT2 family glycosyltransferase